METQGNAEEATDVLQQLGLKEYEARCFVGLTRLNTGTAKELSELTDVPRTRVYDAIRILEAQGLVEIQHSSPQKFRAIPLEEAIKTFRHQYKERVERLHNTLDTVELVEDDEDSTAQRIWSMNGQSLIETRTEQLIEKSTTEIVLVIGHESLLTEALINTLNDIGDGVELIIGTTTSRLREKVQSAVPNATTFISGLEWLRGDETNGDEMSIGRLLLVDRSTVLVSSIASDTLEEQAIFGEGFGNGLVIIARRIMAHGLLPGREPRQ